LLFFFFFIFFADADGFLSLKIGARAWSGETFAKELDRVLEPPRVRRRVKRGPLKPIVFELEEHHRFLPVRNYPCSGGLMNIACFYKPNMPLFSRHLEWEPLPKLEHRVLVSSVLRRASCVGTLHERFRALEKVFQQVMSENSNLFGELERLRGLLEGGGQQEDILKVSWPAFAVVFVYLFAHLKKKDDFGTRAGDAQGAGAGALGCGAGPRRDRGGKGANAPSDPPASAYVAAGRRVPHEWRRRRPALRQLLRLSAAAASRSVKKSGKEMNKM